MQWGQQQWGQQQWGGNLLPQGIISSSYLGANKASHLGGESFFIYAESLKDIVANDSFPGISINSLLWNSSVTGSASIGVSNGNLLCDTSAISSSTSKISGKLSHSGDFDFSIDYEILSDITGNPPIGNVSLAVLEVTTGSETLRFTHAYNIAELGNEFVLEVSKSGIAFKQIIPTTQKSGNLRIIRAGSDIFFILNTSDILLSYKDWVSGNVSTNIYSSNNSQAYRVVTQYDNFKRIPTVVFGNNIPCIDAIVPYSNRITGTFPAYPYMDQEQVSVTTSINSYSYSKTLVNSIIYIIANEFTIQSGITGKMQIINLPELRNSEANSPGFEIGGRR